MISDSKQFAFVHIPRTGGTSIETAMARYSRTPVGYTVHECTVLPHKHCFASELSELFPEEWAHYFTFSIVRNPWERMVSDYHFFKSAGPHLYPEFSAMERSLTDQANRVDFNTWLRANAEILNISQLDYLTDENGDHLVDFVGRFESLGDDFAHICRTLDVDAKLPFVNRVERRHYREYYDVQSVELVGEHSRADIAQFGYTF